MSCRRGHGSREIVLTEGEPEFVSGSRSRWLSDFETSSKLMQRNAPSSPDTEHVNPKQTAKVRPLMDEMPKGEPLFACPMPNVECTKASLATLGVAAEVIVSVVAPQILRHRSATLVHPPVTGRLRAAMYGH